MKKLILAAAIILTSFVSSFAGETAVTETATTQASVSGVVVDKTTSETLAGVSITANGQKVYTDLDGNFTISNLCGSTCTIVVSQISYEPQIVELNLQNNQALNVLLSKR